MAARTSLRRLTSLARSRTSLPCSGPYPHLLRQQATASSASSRQFSLSSHKQVKKYTEDHEWIELDTDGTTGTIGVSTYAANALGDVVYVELPTINASVNAGDTIGAVESVKSASDIMTPVTGMIIETNKLLEEKPGTINKKPEEDGEAGGWIARIRVEKEALKELEELMGKEAYDKFTGD